VSSTDLAAKAAFYGVIVCWWGFALTFWLRKRPPRAQATKRDTSSYLGLLLQAFGYFLVWYRALQHRQSALVTAGPEWWAWVMAAVSVGMAAASVGLVIWAARCLGKQWSLGARLVEDHDLIEDGPYRFVRNPIYTGMFGILVATGLAVAPWAALLAAMVLFAVGTLIRIRIEERLLREAFGERFAEYARRVPALIPGIY
jgi:protein-S-isoprenylcysteine O-methyltransferase Ste14